MTDLDAKLHIPTWFTNPRLVAGLPAGLAFTLALAALYFGVIVGWWFGLLLLVFTYPPFVTAYRHDPNALQVWRHVLSDAATTLNLSDLRETQYHFH